MDFLDNSKFYKNKIMKWDKKVSKSIKRVEEETVSDNELIDDKTEDFFFDFRNETKNRFIVKEDFFYLYITKNPYKVCLVDFMDSFIYHLYCCFKVIRIERSPFTFKRNGYICDLLILVGADEVLFLLLDVVEEKKYFEVSLHIKNTGFIWEKILFIDKTAFLVKNENNDLYFVLLDNI